MKNIQAKILDYEIVSTELIQNNTYAKYCFVEAWFVIEIEVFGEKHYANLQTGLFYDHNDYRMPTNTLRVHDESSDELICTIIDNKWNVDNKLNGLSLDEINDKLNSSFSEETLKEIESALTNIINEAQKIVDDEAVLAERYCDAADE